MARSVWQDNKSHLYINYWLQVSKIFVDKLKQLSQLFYGKWQNSLSANFRGMGGHPPTTVGVRKLESWAITWRCLRNPTFSHFDTILACDRHTDRHATMANNRASLASRR